MKLNFQCFLAVRNDLEVRLEQRTCYLWRRGFKVIFYKNKQVDDILAGHLAISDPSLGFLNQPNHLYNLDKM